MTDIHEENAALQPDDERLTPFGRFLNVSSLDVSGYRCDTATLMAQMHMVYATLLL